MDDADILNNLDIEELIANETLFPHSPELQADNITSTGKAVAGSSKRPDGDNDLETIPDTPPDRRIILSSMLIKSEPPFDKKSTSESRENILVSPDSSCSSGKIVRNVNTARWLYLSVDTSGNKRISKQALVIGKRAAGKYK